MYLLKKKPPSTDAARQPAGLRHHPAREPWRQGAARAGLGGIGAHVWSCLSFNELARDGQDAERWNLLHPTELARVPFVTQQLSHTRARSSVASTDYMKNYAEQIRAFIPKGRSYKVLGTDGFGRSDFRSKLREHFEVNRHYIVVAALKAWLTRARLVPRRWPRPLPATASRQTRSTRCMRDHPRR